MKKNGECKKIKKFLWKLESVSNKISEMEISDKIKKFIQEKFKQNPPNILFWEQIAFDFVENYPEDKSGWGTYFGPMLFILPNKEGKMDEYPSIHNMTPEIISYWENRAKESSHPVFKARYSNLVWDFSEKVKKEKPAYSIAQIFVDSVIEIAKKDLHKCDVDVITKLERALSLALSINDGERINKLVDAVINYEEKIAEDDKPGLWGFSYELLVKNKKVSLSKEKEQKIIKELEKRFERLLKGSNHWAAKRAAILLADYYFRVGNSIKVKDVLLKLGNMIQNQAEQASPLPAGAWLEKLYHLYLQYGLKDEADKISIKIKELGEKSLSELKKIETSIEIPKKEIDEFINKLIEGDLKTALMKIAVYYIPKEDDVIKQLKDFSQKTPVSFLFARKILDHEGRVISTVGSLEEDIDGHIVLQISQNIQFSSFFLRETINALIRRFNLDAKTVVNYFYKSPIFDEKRKGFFIKGIEAYLNNDFLVALHVLIPQIEALIRNLAEKIGIPVLKHSRSGGFNYRTLDELLRDENIVNVLTEDMCLYLRVLFTDPRGWNFRNNICHGISQIEDFKQITADRVFHALLCLSLVKEKEEKE